MIAKIEEVQKETDTRKESGFGWGTEWEYIQRWRMMLGV